MTTTGAERPLFFLHEEKQMITTAKRVTKKEFLEATNGNARTRLFDAADFKNFQNARAKAKRRAKAERTYYKQNDGGGVSNSYNYCTTTPRWTVWSMPNGEVGFIFDRPMVSGPNVARGYYQGSGAYCRAFKSNDIETLRKAGK